jgi:hypothetical protein
MPNAEPVEGRCNATLTRKKGFCANYPLKGVTRCVRHGGKQQRDGRPDSRTHGRHRKMHIRGATEKMQDEIDAAVRDPNLLDVRRTVALSELALGDSMLFPNDELLLEMAKSLWWGSLGTKAVELMMVNQDDLDTPPDYYIDLARRSYMKETLRLVERHGRTQVAALRQIELGRLMRQAVVPMFTEMGLRLGKLIDRYVPEDKREDFRSALRVEFRATLHELDQLRDRKDLR